MHVVTHQALAELMLPAAKLALLVLLGKNKPFYAVSEQHWWRADPLLYHNAASTNTANATRNYYLFQNALSLAGQRNTLRFATTSMQPIVST